MTNHAALAPPGDRFALRAEYLFPVVGPPIAGGVLTIEGERILAVGANLSGRSPRDLGRAAILPGLVNAHTHLEFSHLRVPLGTPGMAFADWLRAVLAARADHDPAESIRRGLAESLAGGVTTIGEIVTSGWTPATMPEASCRATLFRELIGLSPERVTSVLDAAAEHSSGWNESANLSLGLSPHAPYTAPPALVAGAVALARRHRLPVAMHLAESRAELELLASKSGPLAELLRDRGVWRPELFGGRGVGELLAMLAKVPRTLVIHGNYLGPPDWKMLAERRESMSVVYCPRTHHYFAHEPYPLAEMLATGVAVAFGTDSRASNPDLNFLDELRFIARAHPSVAPATILELGTLGGAQALGVAGQTGSLAAGKLADLCVAPLANSAATDPHRRLLDSTGGALETWYRGRLVHAS